MTSLYGERVTLLLKKWTTNNTRLAAFRNRRIFLLECKRQDLTPPHIGNGMKNINNLFELNSGVRLNRKVAEFNEKLTGKIIRLEIEHTQSTIKRLERIQDENLRELNSMLPQTTVSEFLRRQNITYTREFHRIGRKNREKISRLIERRKTKYKTQEKWFKNLTTELLPEEVKTTLSLGNKFGISTNIRETSLRRLVADIENILDMIPNDERDLLRAKTTSIVTNHFHKYKDQTRIIDFMFNKTKNFLRIHDHLLVLNSDKGSVTVVMTKDEYLQKMQTLLNTDSFKEISRDPTTTIQTKTNKIITDLKNIDAIDDVQAKLLRKYNSIAPRIYGNPKLHKIDVPLRPIVSDVQGPTINLARFIAKILTDAYDTNNEFYVKDTFEIAQMLNNFKLPPNYILVSLDVVNLFGNITEDLVYEAVKERWDNIEQHCSIQKEKFMDIIEFLLKNGYFVFEGRYFIQTLGCSMGSKLSPILSLYVMDYLIRKCIPKLIFKPPFLKKFVDDVITAIPNTEKENVPTIFNGFNEHIQFTMEEEDEKQSIPFLDMRVYRCDDIIKLDWCKGISYGELTGGPFENETECGELATFLEAEIFV
ncbi:uncharacterized protein LOC123313987 [Coccinella septempunctata]|uniref:uncharacterized protein LOC123313987 n=1 Tax=Coccinella septempunctata TaxID=41139 RepID=UPI001D0784E3|nr:uncharacterized protein LOC123313987 [Coccinella septempunctata]